MISLIRTSSQHPDFQQLVRLLNADLNARYGALQAAYDGHNAIEPIKTIVLAYDDQEPAGGGGMKLYDNETIEIKRMFVKSTHRGMGIARKILAELETWAVELGFTRAILETGIKQVEAISLYEKNGYQLIENYGPYAKMENSLCFEKELRITLG